MYKHSALYKEIHAVFFWDTLLLKDGTATFNGSAISSIAESLDKRVFSFASDNCSAMKKAEDVVVTQSGRSIPRGSCGSHALNNIFQNIMKMKPFVVEKRNGLCVEKSFQ